MLRQIIVVCLLFILFGCTIQKQADTSSPTTTLVATGDAATDQIAQDISNTDVLINELNDSDLSNIDGELGNITW